MYKKLIRPFLFHFDPEKVHVLICFLLRIPLLSKILGLIWGVKNWNKELKIDGLNYSNPVGLAAGFDKDALLVDQMADLGFGFVEIGTVTPLPQAGNPKPRLFRLPNDHALLNRMGFNNQGVERIRENLLKSKRQCIIGGNIGKNKNTPNSEALSDYEICFKRLYDVVDYFVVNVSSPNTPGLRELQEAKSLTELLEHMQILNKRQLPPKPIYLKIAPDLNNNELDDIIKVAKNTKISGIIATNTTINRQHLSLDTLELEQLGEGGLSGKPLHTRALEVIRYLKANSENSLSIIGVGGVHSPQDAIEMQKAGASLVQLYTGFIYEGPQIIGKITEALLKKDSFAGG
jgi:dihydroorotate dehydrogenase